MRRQTATEALSRIDRPEAVLIAILMAIVAAVGWLVSPLWLAIMIAAELAIGGIGAVVLIGPVRPDLGFARYATLAIAGVAMALLGRLVAPGAGLLLAPVAALLLWGVIRIELDLADGSTRRVGIDLVLVGIVFTAAAGINALVPPDSWPPGLVLLLLIAAVPALRAAEARGRSGVAAVGQAVLHLVAVAQLGAATGLLGLPGVVGSAIVALGFHAWGGAAEALDDGASTRAVVLEFGALGVLGLVVALLLSGS
jgi:hypothetical protein